MSRGPRPFCRRRRHASSTAPCTRGTAPLGCTCPPRRAAADLAPSRRLGRPEAAVSSPSSGVSPSLRLCRLGRRRGSSRPHASVAAGSSQGAGARERRASPRLRQRCLSWATPAAVARGLRAPPPRRAQSRAGQSRLPLLPRPACLRSPPTAAWKQSPAARPPLPATAAKRLPPLGNPRQGSPPPPEAVPRRAGPRTRPRPWRSASGRPPPCLRRREPLRRTFLPCALPRSPAPNSARHRDGAPAHAAGRVPRVPHLRRGRAGGGAASRGGPALRRGGAGGRARGLLRAGACAPRDPAAAALFRLTLSL